MSNAAARLGDHHQCLADGPPAPNPKCFSSNPKHVGGPIVTGSPDVYVNGLAAARGGDQATCKMGPPNVIVTGAEMVLINGQPAARIKSKMMHETAGFGVFTGSPDVFYGGPTAGATLGNPGAATAACLEAAMIGRNGSQRQSKPMNCGPESVRQVCVQACANGNQAACKYCNMDEDEWYQEYCRLSLPEMNKSRAAARKDHADKNAATQAKIDALPADSKKPMEKKFSDVDHDTEALGYYQLPNGEKAYYYDETCPADVTEEDIQSGRVGSRAETRTALLAQMCGVSSKQAPNSKNDIGVAVATGQPVIVSVDMAYLYPPVEPPSRLDTRRGPGGPIVPGQPGNKHAVTVSGYVYDENGRLKEVVMNDTSDPAGCGKHVNADDFNKALKKDTPTNVPAT